jgi:hypothetical protein
VIPVNPVQETEMKARWKILIAVGIFMALSCAVSFLTMRLQPENEVEAYKKLLREKGEKLEISEVLPPQVPAESNSVDAVEDAFGMFGSSSGKIPDAMKMVAPGKAMVGWMQPEVHGYDNSGSNFTNSWDDFAADNAADRPAIELLHQVLERPKLDFQPDYKKGVGLLLPQLSSLKRSAQKLEAATVLDLHNCDTGAAATNILTILALVQKNEGEGLLISHLVRLAMAAIAVVPTWELLQATNVTDAQLAAVQTSWEQMDFLRDGKNSFLMERAWGMETIEKYRASHEEFAKSFGISSFSSTSTSFWEALTEKPRYMIGEVMWRSSWSYSDELQTLQSDSIILDTLRTMQTNQSQFYKADYDAMTVRLSSLGITNAGEAFFRALKIPEFSDEFGDGRFGVVVLKIIRMESTCRVIVTAIALKRFQLKHGKLPETLDEMSPEFLRAVPIDPYDGKPLRYHPNADGTYMLYCVGEDGVDDGGDPSVLSAASSLHYYWQNANARDWVWPQPATPAEVQFFYDHPPK